MRLPCISPLLPYKDAVGSLPEEEFRTIQGRRIHFQSEGQGKVIVFLHGMAASSYSFRNLVPYLSGDYRTITVDLNGFGFSERATELDSYRLERQAEAMRELLEDLGIGKVSLFGHSLGCAVSVYFANRFPGWVDQVFLVSPVSKFEKPPWYMRNGVSLRLLYLATRLLLSRPEMFQSIMGRAFCRKTILTSGASEEYRRQLLVEGFRDAFYGYAVALSRELRIAEEYSQLSVPVKFVGGENDEIVLPESLRELKGLIPQAELSFLPGCGHSAPEEFPKEVSELVRSFLPGGMGKPT